MEVLRGRTSIIKLLSHICWEQLGRASKHDTCTRHKGKKYRIVWYIRYGMAQYGWLIVKWFFRVGSFHWFSIELCYAWGESDFKSIFNSGCGAIFGWSGARSTYSVHRYGTIDATMQTGVKSVKVVELLRMPSTCMPSNGGIGGFCSFCCPFV